MTFRGIFNDDYYLSSTVGRRPDAVRLVRLAVATTPVSTVELGQDILKQNAALCDTYVKIDRDEGNSTLINLRPRCILAGWHNMSKIQCPIEIYK